MFKLDISLFVKRVFGGCTTTDIHFTGITEDLGTEMLNLRNVLWLTEDLIFINATDLIIACVCWHVVLTNSPIDRYNPALLCVIYWFIQAFEAFYQLTWCITLCIIYNPVQSLNNVSDRAPEISCFYLARMPLAHSLREIHVGSDIKHVCHLKVSCLPSLSHYLSGSCETPASLKHMYWFNKDD